jgi:hypothetical protein
MNLPRVVLTIAVLVAAAPTLATNMPSTVITTGSWVVSKPGNRIAGSSNAPHTPIMTGAWTPSKPGMRPSVANILRVAVTTGPSVSSKPWGRPAGSR